MTTRYWKKRRQYRREQQPDEREVMADRVFTDCPESALNSIKGGSGPFSLAF
jgi:hypothetical protein